MNIHCWADASRQRNLGEMFQTEFLLIAKSQAVHAWESVIELCNLEYKPLAEDDSTGQDDQSEGEDEVQLTDGQNQPELQHHISSASSYVV